MATSFTIAAKNDTTIEADGREVRVSSADRVIFPATKRTGEVTKLQIAEYYVAVGDGIMRALRERPTTLERWPKGVHEGMTISTREGHKGDAFYQKRIPKGAPDWVETARIEFPSGRSADEVCPTELGTVAWCAQMGTLTFHPWPVRRADVDHPDELRLDLDPQPGTDFDDAVQVAGEARTLLDELEITGFPKTSGGRGIHIYVRIEPKWTFTDVRHAAIAFGRELERRMPGRVTTKWWKEERGETVFVDYNQNARDRTIASPYSVRAKPGAPVSAPLEWDELQRRTARGLHRRVDAGPIRRGWRPVLRDRRQAPFARAAPPDVRTGRVRGRGRHAISPRLPEDAGRAEARPAFTRSRPEERRVRGSIARQRGGLVPGNTIKDGGIMRNSKWILMLIGILACGLIAAGCGDDDDDSSSDEPATEESSDTSSDDTESEDTDSGEGTVDVDEFLSSCEETVEGTPGADTAIAACEDAADALEQCADQANASGDEDLAEEAIALCQQAADDAVKQFEALGG